MATLLFAAHARADTSYVFDNTTGTLTISGDGTMTQLGVKSAVGGTLKNVVIEHGITGIGEHAFYHDYGDLKSVTIADTVASIGQNAFWGCSSLESIAIPANVTHIRENAFSDCTSLTTLSFGGTQAQWDRIGIVLPSNVTVTCARAAITFNANGGEASPTQRGYDKGAQYGTLPTPTRQSGAAYSYAFDGWYTAVDGGVLVIASGMPSEDATLYARWTAAPIEYDIACELDGGTITLANPEKTGYIFAGWTGSNGSATQESVTIAKGSTGKMTCTANWKGDIASAAVTIGPLVHNGRAQAPAVTVRYGGAALVAGTDCTLSVTPQTGAGSFPLTVSGMGDYTGSKTVPWSISKADPGLSIGKAAVGTVFSKKVGKATLTYRVTGKGAVTLVKVSTPENVSKLTIPATVSFGTAFKVTVIGKKALAKVKAATVVVGKNAKRVGAKAFAVSSVKTLKVRSGKLTKKSRVRNCLKENKVTKVKALGSKKKKTRAAFKTWAGKTVKVS